MLMLERKSVRNAMPIMVDLTAGGAARESSASRVGGLAVFQSFPYDGADVRGGAHAWADAGLAAAGPQDYRSRGDLSRRAGNRDPQRGRPNCAHHLPRDGPPVPPDGACAGARGLHTG